MFGEFKETAAQATKTLKEVEGTALHVRTVTLPKVELVLDNLYTITAGLRVLVEAFARSVPPRA